LQVVRVVGAAPASGHDVVDLQCPHLRGHAAELTAKPGALEDLVPERPRDVPGRHPPVLPDALATLRLVFVELGLAPLDQVLDLLVAEVLVPHERVTIILPLDDAVPLQDAPDHVLGDVLVVFNLTLVVGEDGSGDLLG
jgi:hypothetical protein